MRIYLVQQETRKVVRGPSGPCILSVWCTSSHSFLSLLIYTYHTHEFAVCQHCEDASLFSIIGKTYYIRKCATKHTHTHTHKCICTHIRTHAKAHTRIRARALARAHTHKRVHTPTSHAMHGNTKHRAIMKKRLHKGHRFCCTHLC